MEAPALTIKAGIALMISKRLGVAFAMVALCGCVGKANHPQCQSLKAEAAGSQFGAVLAGTYIAHAEADIDERQYERCEEMFDMAQYQAQLQQQAHQQEQERAQAQQQERERLVMDKLNSPEVQKELRADSLKDLVSCTKGVEGEKLPPNVLVVAEGMCKKEIDRRVDSGKVSRSKVDKMINQGV